MGRCRFLPVILLIFALWSVASAQSGPWVPPNADLSYPRTLLRASEVDSVRLALSNPIYSYVYENIFGGAESFMPDASLMVHDNWRRAHAHAAKNCAFIYLLDRQKYPGLPIDTLTPAQRDTFLHRSIRCIEIMNTNVESIPDWDPYLWRSDELADNVIAYDLLKGAGVPDSLLTLARFKLEEYATNLHTQITGSFFGFTFFGTKVNNHGIRAAATIALAGLVLNTANGADDDAQATAWVHTGLFHIDNILWRSGFRQSEPDVVGGYTEGPHYLRFGMKHGWTLIHAFGNILPDTVMATLFDGSTHNIRNPWYDRNYVNLAEWVCQVFMPDGRMPSIEDAFVDFGYPELCQLERPELVTLMTYSHMDVWQTRSLNQDLQHSSDDIRAEFICSRTLPVPNTRRLVSVLPVAGDLVLRSSWDTTALYLHAVAKHGIYRSNANGHNQADETSFILHAFGEVLALDAGYLKYDRRDAVDEATHHNMILVDGAGPLGGSTLNAGGADAYVDYGFDIGGLRFGRVHTSYLGADIERNYWMVRGSLILDADAVFSGSAHTYTWQCHGMGLEGGDSLHGTFIWNSGTSEGTWKKNAASLLTHVTEASGSPVFSHAASVHEFTYDSASTHTVLLADKAGSSNAHFLTALHPYLTDTPSVQTLTAPAGYNYLFVDDLSHHDFLVPGADLPVGSSALTGPVHADGVSRMYFSAEASGQWSAWNLHDGLSLLYGSDSLMISDTRMDIALCRKDSADYIGYAGAPGTVSFAVEFVPGSVNGFGVNAWSYDALTGRVTVTFGAADEFYIHKDVIAGQPAITEKAGLAIWPNPAHGLLNISIPAPGYLTIRDIHGKLLADSYVPGGLEHLDCAGLAKGIYLVKWEDEKGRIAVSKVVVE